MAAGKQISYGLKFQARALVALPGEGHSRWLVGTNALRDENEVSFGRLDNDCLPAEGAIACSRPQTCRPLPEWVWCAQVVVLDYDPDAETLKMAESHSHPAEIWQLASCPAGDPRTLLSVYSEGASCTHLLHRVQQMQLSCSWGVALQSCRLQTNWPVDSIAALISLSISSYFSDELPIRFSARLGCMSQAKRRPRD